MDDNTLRDILAKQSQRADAFEKENIRLRNECNEWRAAIESVAFGAIPSPLAARTAIKELFDKSERLARERDELRKVLFDLGTVAKAMLERHKGGS